MHYIILHLSICLFPCSSEGHPESRRAAVDTSSWMALWSWCSVPSQTDGISRQQTGREKESSHRWASGIPEIIDLEITGQQQVRAHCLVEIRVLHLTNSVKSCHCEIDRRILRRNTHSHALNWSRTPLAARQMQRLKKIWCHFLFVFFYNPAPWRSNPFFVLKPLVSFNHLCCHLFLHLLFASFLLYWRESKVLKLCCRMF